LQAQRRESLHVRWPGERGGSRRGKRMAGGGRIVPRR
jgi:hypothetical protein